VLPLNPLLGGMVAGEGEPGVAEADLHRLGPLVAVEAGQVGNERFDDEDTIVSQVCRDTVEAANLRLLRLQGKERVENDVHKRVPTLDRNVREVADGHGNRLSALFRLQASDHRLRGIDAMDIDSTFGKGERNAPGPHGQFEHGSGASLLGEERDGAVRILGENLWPLVVDIGKAVAVSRRSVLLDGQILRPAEYPQSVCGRRSSAPVPARLDGQVASSPNFPFPRRRAYARYGERLPTIFLDRNVIYHSTVECPDYPQPPEAWWAWPHYQKGI
jgi:hypothetical protein